MKVVILGAGSTIGTFNGAFGVAAFSGRLNEVDAQKGGSWRDKYPGLADAIRDSETRDVKPVNLDRLWTRIDYYSKFSRMLGVDPYRESTSGELHKALIDAYALREEIEALLALPAGTIFTLKTILEELEPGDTLLSFNWDTVAESLASKLFDKKLSAAGTAGADGHIRLIKPHGSLSWRHHGANAFPMCCDVQWNDAGAPLLEPMTAAEVGDVPNAHFCEPLTLGAVPIKSELIDSAQRATGHCRVFETIAGQWAEVVRALVATDDVVVAGYGFPTEDQYGHFILREAMWQRRKRNPDPPAVTLYSLPRDRCGIEASMRDVFGDRTSFTFAGKIDRAPLA